MLSEIVVANANWSRTIEGLLDSSHTGVLHQDALKLLGTGKGPAPSFSGRARSSTGAVISKDLAPPSIEVQETDFGLRYAALRSFTTPRRRLRDRGPDHHLLLPDHGRGPPRTT